MFSSGTTISLFLRCFGGSYEKSSSGRVRRHDAVYRACALAERSAGNPTNTGFLAQQPGDRLASRLVGLNIQNTGDDNIGDLRHHLDRRRSCQSVHRQRGWLSRHGYEICAIDPKALTLTRQDEKNWKATMNANKDQLKAAPEYKYELEWRKR